MDDDLALAMLPLQYPVQPWVPEDRRDVRTGGSSAEGYRAAQGFGASNTEAEAE